MLSKFLDPKNDIAFRKIFGSEKNQDILIHFLNDILVFKEKKPIKEVQFLKAEEGYIQSIQGTTAAVIIGDRALANLSKFNFVYDLGEAWLIHTGLPFVFAAWMSNQPIPESFQILFNQANAYGIEHVQEVLQQLPDRTHDYDMEQYYTKNIEYKLTDDMQQGMRLFLEKAKQLAS